MSVKAQWFGLLILAFSYAPLMSQELLDRVEENFTGIETVSIKGSFCQTEIVSGAENQVSLEGEIRSVRRYQDLRIRYAQTGTQLDIWIERPHSTTGQIRGLLFLSVPAQTQVLVSNLSGSISVSGVGSNISTLETLSGDVEVKNSPGALKINTTSGNIHGAVIGGSVYAHSVSGNVSMKDVRGSCHLSSISGNVKVSAAFEGVELNTTSGNISLSDVVGAADVKSASGEIAVFRLKGNAVATSSSGSLRVEEVVGTLDLTTISGTIKGQQVMLTGLSKFRNGSGHIDIMFSNDPETLSFDLKTVSGRLDVRGLIAEKQLIKGDGPVRVTGSTTSGNQTYR
ncbi:MAG: DUF4097 family beta strand repeat-containing protein [Bacteroidales bacterium]|nr:DUF4097 family beta strand repeat-containing protein [Bacteroidales bacterium]